MKKIPLNKSQHFFNNKGDVFYFYNIREDGTKFYSCEISIGHDDKIILDDKSLEKLQNKVTHILPVAICSRCQ